MFVTTTLTSISLSPINVKQRYYRGYNSSTVTNSDSTRDVHLHDGIEYKPDLSSVREKVIAVNDVGMRAGEVAIRYDPLLRPSIFFIDCVKMQGDGNPTWSFNKPLSLIVGRTKIRESHKLT